MSRIAEIRRSVEDYQATELVTGALRDISATKMQLIRKQFEQNIRFFEGVREVYGVVKAHALDHSDTAGQEAPRKQLSRDIYIALTSNKRFYGTLNRDIVRSFVRVARTAADSDFLMIGQTGAHLLESSGFRGAVKRMEFQDDTPSHREVQEVLSLINSYARVFVVYPKFVNTFRQDVVMTDVTQTPDAAASPEMRADYIFEPEVSRMLAFFEAQVRNALFERIMLETELARTAARALRMREAGDRASDLRKQYGRSLRREVATFADLELMETFIGFNFWKQ